ncbi:hypothetical protein AC579_9144 [Pseudocercospora musae]|uniref:Uncharacterized protein n=1 Tax=Pseudocercospora musae TaxID=113226 RepID=A0A139IJ35_9PEZI|nr:hypothetical protein AC579_9144 [Pseudocercospora musae]
MAHQLLGDVDGLLEMNHLGRLSGISETAGLRAFGDRYPRRRARLEQRERRLAACSAVLNIAELLERILPYLDIPIKLHPGALVGKHSRDLCSNSRNTKTNKRVAIFSCLRVSKYWNLVISTSPMLKQRIWLVQPLSPVNLGRRPQEEFSKTAMAYERQTSASLSIFAPHRLAPVTLNPILFPYI